MKKQSIIPQSSVPIPCSGLVNKNNLKLPKDKERLVNKNNLKLPKDGEHAEFDDPRLAEAYGYKEQPRKPKTTPLKNIDI